MSDFEEEDNEEEDNEWESKDSTNIEPQGHFDNIFLFLAGIMVGLMLSWIIISLIRIL